MHKHKNLVQRRIANHGAPHGKDKNILIKGSAEARRRVWDSQAAGSPDGLSLLQLNVTGSPKRLEEIQKEVAGCKKLLNQLRFKCWEGASGPSVIKDIGLSAGVLTMARQHIDCYLPATGREGIKRYGLPCTPTEAEPHRIRSGEIRSITPLAGSARSSCTTLLGASGTST